MRTERGQLGLGHDLLRYGHSTFIAQHSVLCAAVCAMLFALCSRAEAQQPKKLPRIGYLTVASRTGSAHLTQALLQGIHELGYVAGQNIVIEYRWADGNFERLPEL